MLYHVDVVSGIIDKAVRGVHNLHLVADQTLHRLIVLLQSNESWEQNANPFAVRSELLLPASVPKFWAEICPLVACNLHNHPTSYKKYPADDVTFQNVYRVYVWFKFTFALDKKLPLAVFNPWPSNHSCPCATSKFPKAASRCVIASAKALQKFAVSSTKSMLGV